MELVNSCYDNASFLIVEESTWLQLLYLLTKIVLWFIKLIFRSVGTLWINCFIVMFKNLPIDAFIAQISHYGKIHATA